jgi:hypothetical protein
MGAGLGAMTSGEATERVMGMNGPKQIILRQDGCDNVESRCDHAIQNVPGHSRQGFTVVAAMFLYCWPFFFGLVCASVLESCFPKLTIRYEEQ